MARGAVDEHSLRYEGWRITAAAGLGVFFSTVAFYTFAVFLKPVSGEFGWSRQTVSSAYGVMAFRTAKAVSTATPQADHPLMDWLDDHGNGLLMLELTLLAIGTCGAIATDDYWQRRAARRR